MGISRYYSSTNTPPNKFKTLQNVYSPNRGELAVIPGVEELVHTIPNCSAISDVTFFENQFGDQSWLVHYDTATANFTAPPTTFSFSSPTGSPTGTMSVLIEYVYGGGSTKVTTITGVSFGSVTSSGIAFTYSDCTLPTSAIPDGVYCINYYIIYTDSSRAIWVGSHMRKDGIFPPTSDSEKTIRLFRPSPIATPTASVSSAGAVAPSVFDIAPTTSVGGALESGKIYYFAYVPLLHDSGAYTYRRNDCHFYTTTTANGRMSCFLPEGYNSFIATMTVPISAGAPDAQTVLYGLLLMGTTPENMAPIGYATFENSGFKYKSTPLRLQAAGVITPVIGHLPYNTNKNLSMATYNSTPSPIGTSITGRVSGTMEYTCAIGGSDDWFGTEKIRTKGLASIQLPYSATSHKEQLPGLQFTFTEDQNLQTLTSKRAQQRTGTSYPADGFHYGFNFQYGKSLNSVQYENLAIFANGHSNLYQTDGYLCAPLVGNDARVMPITKNISMFRDKMILGCGDTNWSYDSGLVFYSESGVIRNFGTGAGQYLNLNFGNASEMIGFGVFSMDLSTVGPSSFLVIGKRSSIYTWNGATSASEMQLNQISKAVGWLSSKSFGLTKNGPVVVTNQGLYGIGGADIQEIDPGTEKFFSEMSPSLHDLVRTVFSEDRFIVGYSTSSTSVCDKELWYDFRDEPDGGKVVVPTGPHSMKDYQGIVNSLKYGSISNYRLSWGGTSTLDKLYRRDKPSLFTNNGSNIAIVIEMNDTGLGVDEFIKRLTRLYIRAKINQQETITITIPSRDQASLGEGLDYDGSGLSTVSESMVLPYTGVAEIYRLFQKVFTSRYRGTIFTPKLELSTDVDFRIVSLSLLYEIQRRRLL